LGAAGIGAGPGIFVEADARMAAERVLQLLEDPAAARQAGAEGRSRVLRHHSWVASARRLEQVWCDVAIPTR
jgi:glycosyltransferase involved in cell wall biosynthesis